MQLMNYLVKTGNPNVLAEHSTPLEYIHDPDVKAMFEYGIQKLKDNPHLKRLDVSDFYDFNDIISTYSIEVHEENIEGYIEQLRNDHYYYELVSIVNSLNDGDSDNSLQLVKTLQAQSQQLLSEVPSRVVDLVKDARLRHKEVEDRRDGKIQFVQSGFPELDTKLGGGFSTGEELVVIMARTGVGKEQPLYSKVLTDTGWKTMGEIQVGDNVITMTGEPAPVVGVFPQGVKPVYRVHLVDGSYVDAGLEHLWTVSIGNDTLPGGKLQVVTTAELMKLVEQEHQTVRLPHSPVCDNIRGMYTGPEIQRAFEQTLQYRQVSRKIDVRFTARMLENSSLRWKLLDIISKQGTPFTFDPDTISDLDYIDDIALQSCIKYDNYFELECDNFTSAKVVADVFRSCGYFIELADGDCFMRGVHPFSCYDRRRRVGSIRQVGDAECQCIMVDHPTHTYITDSFIVTHNTWILTKMLHTAWKGNRNVGLLEPEMTANKIGLRFDTFNSKFSNSSLTYGKLDEAQNAEYEKYIEGLETSQNPFKFLVATPSDLGGNVTVSTLKQFCLSNQLDVLAIDGISYLRDERGKSSDSLSTTYSNISADLMSLSVELEIPIYIVVQSNREGGVGSGGRLSLENVRDSDAISFAASTILGFWKPPEAQDRLNMQILKNRFGPAGIALTYLWDIDNGEFSFVGEGADVEDATQSGTADTTSAGNSNINRYEPRPSRVPQSSAPPFEPTRSIPQGTDCF